MRAPCCEKMGLKKGPWTAEEDQILISFIQHNGHGNWRALPKQAGLLRCGKSCRLRWTNYLRPDIKRGNFSKEEEETIIRLHQILGNRWSAIAGRLPGRTDNEIKNYWHTHLKKRLIKENLISTNDNQISKPVEDLTTPEGTSQSPGDSQQRSGLELSDSVSIEGIDASESNKESKNEASAKGDSSNAMDFWYNIFMQTGNSIEILQQNLGQFE